MKVLNLQCANGHGFEGWFGSDDEFREQNGHGGIECPLCGDLVIRRLPSAPRLNLSGAQAAEPAAPVVDTQAQALWMKAVRHVLEHTTDVGDRFAEEARRIHYGEAEVRGIRGQASAQEREALREEGVEVMSIPLPAALKGPLQ